MTHNQINVISILNRPSQIIFVWLSITSVIIICSERCVRITATKVYQIDTWSINECSCSAMMLISSRGEPNNSFAQETKTFI